MVYYVKCKTPVEVSFISVPKLECYTHSSFQSDFMVQRWSIARYVDLFIHPLAPCWQLV